MTAYQKLRQYSTVSGTHYWSNLYDAKATWIRKNSPWGREQLKDRLYPDATDNYRKKTISSVWQGIRFSELNCTPQTAENEAIIRFLKGRNAYD